MTQEADVILAEGKTKRIIAASPGVVKVVSKDDITAGDGARRDSFPRKAELATTTTCHVFRRLQSRGLPVAYNGRISAVSFLAPQCDMIPLEVVVRRIALGSYPKRNPHVEEQHRFVPPIVELYLKTTDRLFKGQRFPKDDPILGNFDGTKFLAYRPDMPALASTNEIRRVEAERIFGSGSDIPSVLAQIERIAVQAFLDLEAAWAEAGCALADMKVEFGIDAAKNLLIADVIDNDSWRVFDELGQHLDKQRYRDGASLVEVAALYADVAARVQHF